MQGLTPVYPFWYTVLSLEFRQQVIVSFKLIYLSRFFQTSLHKEKPKTANFKEVLDGLGCSCSPDLEHQALFCRPYYLPQQFFAIMSLAVLHSTSSWHSRCTVILHDTINRHLGDLNNTRGKHTLNNCYAPFKKWTESYRSTLLGNQITLPSSFSRRINKGWSRKFRSWKRFGAGLPNQRPCCRMRWLTLIGTCSSTTS